MFNFFLDVLVEPPSFMDRNGRLVWVIAALLALGALVGLFIWKKKKRQQEGSRPNDTGQQP